MIGGMLRVLVVALVLLVTAMVLLPRLMRPVPPPEAATVLDAPRPLPRVELVDQRGRAVATEALAGRFSLVFFGFTHCPDICPLTLQVLAEAKRALEQRDGAETPRVVFVSVDPARDTVERVRDYVRAFDPDFVGLRGEEDDLRPLLDALHVAVEQQEVDGEHYNVVHSGTIYVLNDDADWVALFSGSPDAATIASDFERIRRGARPRGAVPGPGAPPTHDGAQAARPHDAGAGAGAGRAGAGHASGDESATPDAAAHAGAQHAPR